MPELATIAAGLGYQQIKSVVDACGLTANSINISPSSVCVDNDDLVKADSEGAVPNCAAFTAFNTGDAILNLCRNDSWLTSQGAPAGWVHERCPITCGLCVASNPKAVECRAAPTRTTVAPKAPADTPHFVKLTVTMPYTKAMFDQAKQDKYKTAMASAAGTDPANVDILSVTEERAARAASRLRPR